jgi:DNA-binding response OmpR family regulator
MRLLLVEDSHRLRTMLARALKRLGHAVDEAQDAEEGETFAKIHSYDAIVLDVMLPRQGGLQLLERWRRSGKDTPVILLTALNGVDDRVRGLALGADDYRPNRLRSRNWTLDSRRSFDEGDTAKRTPWSW